MLAITAFYAGLLALIVMWLAWEVGRRRRAHRVALGSGGVDVLENAIRAHGNACETVPIAVLLLALAEAGEAPGWVLHLSGLALVAGRALHAIHFVQGRRDFTFRFVGMGLTVVPIILLALGLVGHGLVAMVGDA